MARKETGENAVHRVTMPIIAKPQRYEVSQGPSPGVSPVSRPSSRETMKSFAGVF